MKSIKSVYFQSRNKLLSSNENTHNNLRTDESNNTSTRIIEPISKFYTAEHYICNGSVKLIRTKQSGKIWQMRCWISSEKKYIKKSLRTKDLDTAKEKGKTIYYAIMNKVSAGQKLFTITVNKLFEKHLKNYQSTLDDNFITIERNDLNKRYEPLMVEKYGKNYFDDRNGNNEKRLIQFQMDGKFLKKFKSNGVICDVGCSTGEFLKSILWEGDLYGMEINQAAKSIAQQNGFSFEKNIFTETDFFDVIVFRGTIQHVDEPFRMMKAAFKALKKDGVVIFLATPNTDSILYRLKGDLFFLDSKLNFYIPGKKNLCNALENFGFEVLTTEYPYWNTPYRNFPKDIFMFLLNIFTNRFYKHAFWGSSMSLACKK